MKNISEVFKMVTLDELLDLVKVNPSKEEFLLEGFFRFNKDNRIYLEKDHVVSEKVMDILYDKDPALCLNIINLEERIQLKLLDELFIDVYPCAFRVGINFLNEFIERSNLSVKDLVDHFGNFNFNLLLEDPTLIKNASDKTLEYLVNIKVVNLIMRGYAELLDNRCKRQLMLNDLSA